jgi:glycosyltransferase involved in cell wall biosynthesis
VPTEFNRNTFKNAGIPGDKLQVVPEAIDLNTFHPDIPLAVSAKDLLQEPLNGYIDVDYTQISPDQKIFTFLAIMKWEPRKGWQELISAFVQEFGLGEVRQS